MALPHISVVVGFSILPPPTIIMRSPTFPLLMAKLQQSNSNNVLKRSKKKKNSVPEFTVSNEENEEEDDDESDEFSLIPQTEQHARSLLGTLQKQTEEEDNGDDDNRDIPTSHLEVDHGIADNAENNATPDESHPHSTESARFIDPKNANPSSSSSQTSESNNNGVKVQYAALEVGTVVQIKVGHVARARKAWKKRRRTDSPLLVPCSVLNVDLESTVRRNLIYLLEKFGANVRIPGEDGDSNSNSNSNNSGSIRSGIRISLAELCRRSRTHLKSSLHKHAVDLGYSDPASLVDGLFHNKAVQDSLGVKLIKTSNDDEDVSEGSLWLETPLSRARAQRRASEAAILQFFGEAVPTDPDSVDILQHTGVVRNKRSLVSALDATEEASETAMKTTGGARKQNLYQLAPLSAALRVNQDIVDQGVITDGSLHTAVVFDYDVRGDAGVAPLLTLSLNPQRNQVRDRLMNRQSGTPLSRMEPEAVVHEFRDLHVGNGPISGKVIKLIKGGALVDCGVGRTISEKRTVPVYGVLRFKDAVNDVKDFSVIVPNDQTTKNDIYDNDEDDDWSHVFTIDELDSLDLDEDDEDEQDGNDIVSNDDKGDSEDDSEDNDVLDGEVLAEFNLDNDDEFEEGEDITHLFEIHDDGRLAYTDPETGETSIISDVLIQDDHDDDDENDELDEDDDEMESDVEEPVDNDFEDRPILLGRFATAGSESAGAAPANLYKTQTLRAGDVVDVFVKSISKQSSQILLTMDSTIKGMKAKDVKKESEVKKKLLRLAKQLGGFRSIKALNGIQCDGVIKATSNTGDWYYVQPELENIPMGVAAASDLMKDLELTEGDCVRIQFTGIDENRGQLGMQILSKLPSKSVEV